ncbi:MAG TPA: hypothetical protein VFQ68_13590 [Streptosporangiaceae bacterium]|nr:hypothetical protein [Streptosporangiaceae bacterium]
MRHLRLGRLARSGLVMTAVLAATWTAIPAQAATGPVSSTPAAGTPQLNTTGTTEQVRQLAQCGSTMYAVGSFTSIKRYSTVYARNNVFSFGATSPFKVTSWNPNVNGVVNSIAFSSDCSVAYLGGKFSSVRGTAVNNIAAVSTSTGAVITTFAHSASGQVETLLRLGGHLLTGGYFKAVNGSSANPYFTSLNTTTGKDDGFLHLSISGNYQFPGVSSNPTRVYNQQLSHGGTLDLVEGDFTSAGGQPRQQIFMLNVSGTTATVTPWTSAEFNGPCATVEPYYLQAASWSPDDSRIYIATTGYHPYNEPTGSFPRTGLCDAAAAFPATQASVSHLWVNYTGCDSLYSTAADASTVYIGGHERWASNPSGCDFAGPGAIAAPGMAGLSPATGALTFNPTRDRGLGADDMLLTSAGLWIASDNLDGSSRCAGVYGYAGICFLPYG